MTSIDDIAGKADFVGIQALASRSAGYAVALKCLEVQGEAEARDPSLQNAKGVRLHEDARSWYVGALGEIEVGRMLAELGPEWFVRHSVPIGAGTKDVDHLVIGPGGVFAINTKHHSGASVWVGDHLLRVNNVDQPYLRTARSDGADVARRLEGKVGFPVPVTPVIAILHARRISNSRAPDPDRVEVVNAGELIGWLRSQPRRLDEAALGLITLAAEEPETWHVDPRAADTLRVMQRFERLVANVDAARATPMPPGLRPPRSRTSPARKPLLARGQNGARPSGRNRKPAPADFLRLWFVAAIIIGACLVLRGVADQACTSTISCMLPPIYLALKPLLIFAGVVTALGTLIGTLVLASRMRRG